MSLKQISDMIWLLCDIFIPHCDKTCIALRKIGPQIILTKTESTRPNSNTAYGRRSLSSETQEERS